MKHLLLDTGPIVAFLRQKEEHHAWACAQFERFTQFKTCEAVIAEACARLQRLGGDPADVLEFVEQGAFTLDFRISECAPSIRCLMRKYRDQPMDLADACLVEMSEIYPDCYVVTLDSDFHTYRRRGRDVIPLIIPGGHE